MWIGKLLKFNNITLSSCLTRTFLKMSVPETNLVDKVKDVDIDDTGKFKYILAKVYKTGNPNDESTSKHVVRGYSDCPYHGTSCIYTGVVKQNTVL